MCMYTYVYVYKAGVGVRDGARDSHLIPAQMLHRDSHLKPAQLLYTRLGGRSPVALRDGPQRPQPACGVARLLSKGCKFAFEGK